METFFNLAISSDNQRKKARVFYEHPKPLKYYTENYEKKERSKTQDSTTFSAATVWLQCI